MWAKKGKREENKKTSKEIFQIITLNKVNTLRCKEKIVTLQ